MDMDSLQEFLAAALAVAVIALPLALARWLVRRRRGDRATDKDL